ncbi:MAG: cobalamin-dependent protein [Armatimonadota bacterium]|nr:cobalamin-dependent protein [Armatimonadota bacterium]MDR7438914.1 cobalamin-dependent protein [Armatimonadota bacterium]MDR7562454.1 cobalamin-dependent protein [Armatimonadota bacterium]MDR7567042.1 cobalamin-dependent protein [Armatimonadota bacterium]MDR7601167.1 cobalamin-dependent protein [Armatimonadota bacterium]
MAVSTQELAEAIAQLREQEAVQAARELLEGGASPTEIFEACRQGVEVIGQQYEKGLCFLPELLLAGEILTQISRMVRERYPTEAEARPAEAKVVLGTVQGDIHDIGKNMVAFLLEANGFQVVDLGVDVPPETFVESVKREQAKVVGMSCLLTVGHQSMKRTVQALADAGVREGVRIMIGGAATNEQVRSYVGADAWGQNAADAIRLAREWLGGGGS